MKILLTNAHLDLPGGSENWVRTMAREFLRRGDEVTIFTFKKGRMAQRLEDAGLTVLDRLPEDDAFDLGLINHTTCLRHFLERGRRTYPLIFTSHGPSDPLEQPVAGADHYVAVSEEVRRRCEAAGLQAHVIRNPIDCELFRPDRPIQSRVETILALSHHKHLIKSLKKAGKTLGVEVIFRGHKSGTISWDVQEEINEADLVVSLGRGCLEAMACGRNVIVWGGHGADGYVDDRSILDFRECNCSGRRRGLGWDDWRDFARELERYDPAQGARNREYILANNDARRIANAYFRLAG